MWTFTVTPLGVLAAWLSGSTLTVGFSCSRLQPSNAVGKRNSPLSVSPFQALPVTVDFGSPPHVVGSVRKAFRLVAFSGLHGSRRFQPLNPCAMLETLPSASRVVAGVRRDTPQRDLRVQQVGGLGRLRGR